MSTATEGKHTAAPWNWIKQNGQYIVECRNATIAHIDTLNEADADLIAAAPVVLAELQHAHAELLGLAAYLATCAPGTIIENLHTTIASLDKTADKIEAATRLAKGVQP
jgi:hypothetical protein